MLEDKYKFIKRVHDDRKKEGREYGKNSNDLVNIVKADDSGFFSIETVKIFYKNSITTEDQTMDVGEVECIADSEALSRYDSSSDYYFMVDYEPNLVLVFKYLSAKLKKEVSENRYSKHQGLNAILEQGEDLARLLAKAF